MRGPIAAARTPGTRTRRLAVRLAMALPGQESRFYRPRFEVLLFLRPVASGGTESREGSDG